MQATVVVRRICFLSAHGDSFCNGNKASGSTSHIFLVFLLNYLSNDTSRSSSLRRTCVQRCHQALKAFMLVASIELVCIGRMQCRFCNRSWQGSAANRAVSSALRVTLHAGTAHADMQWACSRTYSVCIYYRLFILDQYNLNESSASLARSVNAPMVLLSARMGIMHGMEFNRSRDRVQLSLAMALLKIQTPSVINVPSEQLDRLPLACRAYNCKLFRFCGRDRPDQR